jgi:hypothetical protein
MALAAERFHGSRHPQRLSLAFYRRTGMTLSALIVGKIMGVVVQP